ncbi:GntR family transcriptional regulator [Chitiniphilus purpureus]|uniref:GntR family transcriptional regulator n=1 Tax=Chitiniphilus purpureus TaxID=2981137 RepID=A0ABY6DJ85_9NEIS|nr:GntR family transcriptional regulator [Chitiniphilus sp. CD1]UXY14429.1 GntR family transcriptional regulator [Chitiniphilus sp. CD1]
MPDKLQVLRVEPRPGQPPHLAFKQRLYAAIAAGYWRPDEALPDVAALARITLLTPEQVERALALLVAEGQLRRDGGACHITPKIDQPLDKLTNLSLMIKARGFLPGSRWLGQRHAVPDDEELASLALRADEQVVRLERLRLADEVVMGMEVSSLPATLVPDPAQIGESLYAFFEARGIVVTNAIQRIEALVCDARLAQLCGCPEGSPVLHLIRISYGAEGQPIELTHSYFRSDYYRFVVELKGTG